MHTITLNGMNGASANSGTTHLIHTRRKGGTVFHGGNLLVSAIGNDTLWTINKPINGNKYKYSQYNGLFYVRPIPTNTTRDEASMPMCCRI